MFKIEKLCITRYDYGMQIKGYNDIKEYDIIESFHEIEIKKKLK